MNSDASHVVAQQSENKKENESLRWHKLSRWEGVERRTQQRARHACYELESNATTSNWQRKRKKQIINAKTGWKRTQRHRDGDTAISEGNEKQEICKGT